MRLHSAMSPVFGTVCAQDESLTRGLRASRQTIPATQVEELE